MGRFTSASISSLVALAAFAPNAWAGQYTLELQPATTRIGWTLAAALHTAHGSFQLKRGSIGFDPASGMATGQIVADVTSGTGGEAALDRKMHAAVLESAKYPEALFVPDRIVGSLRVPGNSSFKVHGQLTLHGATHEIIADVEAKASADRMTATITFDIPYVAWGLKDPSNLLLKVGKTVRVSIEVDGLLKH